ncbi:4-hydroxy-tetrahydrodipicolinate reductase, partial [Stenotrophomonas maltophilia group sp. RNC7]|uniref:4-hydroxy-tetrahydrodipicolinate reductase n=1 Tax=Stenotrophomonas maltophilia group sp. RNC7 TaxID=3071467 RepID=UPI0027E1A49F
MIDFSNPARLYDLLTFCVDTNTAVVIATTGLSEEQEIRIKDVSKKIPVFKSSNTSLGINLVLDLVRKSTNILNEAFDIEIIEKHHNKKIDAPSGTAYMIAQAINEEMSNEMVYNYGREGKNSKRNKNEIGIHAVRGGSIVGEHTVIFAGMDEIIEIKHTALSKGVFARGAIKAA